MFRRRSSRFFVLFVAMLFALPGSAVNLNVMISETQITPADPQRGEFIGLDVAGDGNTLIVSTDPDIGSRGTPAVYVFSRSQENRWVQQAKLIPDEGRLNSEFGQSIDISGNTIAVGDPNFDYIYIFVQEGNAWTLQAKLPEPKNARLRFGRSVAIDKDTVVVGDEGLAHVYARHTGTTKWSYRTTLIAPVVSDTLLAYYAFGDDVDISGDTIVVSIGKYRGGAASVFVHHPSTGTWVQQAELVPIKERIRMGAELIPETIPTRISGGCAVSIHRNRIVVGACGDGSGSLSTAIGAAYIFERNPNKNTWTQKARLAPQGAHKGLLAPYGFGSDIAIVGDTVAVLAKGYSSLFSGVEAPVYLFKRYEDGQWLQQAKVLPTANFPDRYGFFSVAAWDNTIAAGEIFAKDDRENLIGGAVHIVEPDAGVHLPEVPPEKARY